MIEGRPLGIRLGVYFDELPLDRGEMRLALYLILFYMYHYCYS